MADWSATQYLVFERERTRPAADLLAAVLHPSPKHIVDIGCGPGNSTKLLVDRYPQAQVLGIDTSPDMLAKARVSLPSARFEQADVATWKPETPPDLIYGNAVLQWLPDHARLLPHLASLLAPGGVLAIQMPDNLDEPSHALMRDTAAAVPYAAKLGKASGARGRLGSFSDIYGWLRPTMAHVDLWRTTYVHPLDGATAIVEWVKATGLRPFLDPLDKDEQRDLLAQYEKALETAYPRQADGKSLLRFPRLFIVAAKA